MDSSYKKFSLGIVAIAALALLLSSCAPYQAHKGQAYFKQKGKASWYGPGFAGRKTANGERFNPSQLTAAHKGLPFNTTVRVTNLENGKSVVVRINDRGPYAGGRIIDLSKAAAKKIDLIGSGVAMVEIETVSPGGRGKAREAQPEDEAIEKASGMLLAKRGPVRKNGVAYLIEQDGVSAKPPEAAPEAESDEGAREIERVKDIVAETDAESPPHRTDHRTIDAGSIEDRFVVTTSAPARTKTPKPARTALAPKPAPAPEQPAAAPEPTAAPEPATEEKAYSVDDEAF